MPSRWPLFADDEIAAVEAVLRSGKINYWTGDEGRAFEREFAAYVGVPHAVAVANGTVALELALRAVGIRPGDDVIVPARTFVGTATAVAAVGARPIFADVDSDSGVVTVETLQDAWTPAARGAIVVHLAGWPVDMDAVMSWAAERDLLVIEDCAQAHGATWRGAPVGSLGDAGAFSFCHEKIISTGGEGGMVTTASHDVWGRAWSYKDHGRDFDAVERMQGSSKYEFKWLVKNQGTNWRMTEMQAAIGRIQLRKLDGWVAHRRGNAGVLDEGLAGVPGVRIPVPPVEAGHSYYKYYFYVRPGMLLPGWDRSRILSEVNARGVVCAQGACPEIYREQAFAERGYHPGHRLPVASELGETSVMVQVDPTLGVEDMRRVVAVVADVMSEATGHAG